MNANEIVLNIAVNLARLSRWAGEGKAGRIPQFVAETDDYIKLLDGVERNEMFEKTYRSFKMNYERLKQNHILDDSWAEEALTWSNILTHRARLA